MSQKKQLAQKSKNETYDGVGRCSSDIIKKSIDEGGGGIGIISSRKGNRK